MTTKIKEQSSLTGLILIEGFNYNEENRTMTIDYYVAEPKTLEYLKKNNLTPHLMRAWFDFKNPIDRKYAYAWLYSTQKFKPSMKLETFRKRIEGKQLYKVTTFPHTRMVA